MYFQLERALFRLAEASAEDLVGVETDDDVVVRQADGGGISEQDKLSFQTSGHPFQDRSKGLWNSLLIWLEAAQTGTPFHKRAQLWLVTTRDVPRSALAARIGASEKTEAEINECVKALRVIASDPRDDIADLVRRVAAFDDEAITSVIRRVRLEDRAAGVAQLRAKTVSLLHLPPDSNSDRIVHALLGWMHDTLMDLWRQRRAGWIDRTAFDRQLHAILDSLRRSRRRERAASLIAVSQADRDGHRARAFVERLLEIDADTEDVEQAIEDLLRFSTEQMRLSAEGDVVPDDWTSFFDELDERWKIILRRHRRNRQNKIAEAVGRDIYGETVESEYRARFAGEATEHRYFTAGGYHTRADVGRVHWHPDGPQS
ncbi:ABC-three component system protein [Sorangium sp. So ce381]|uniref:ABC-three component system protein n=1 Tax=Sorangium sp. So ce381 TaxID=3133307 RepID=UPI003F5B5285